MNHEKSPSAATSSYLLLFRDASASAYRELSADQRQQLLKQWNDWYDGLVAAGKVKHGHPLEGTGRVITSRGDRVVDGPYAESKEAIGGYFFLTVGSLEEAVAIGRECPSLKLDLGFSVEVRPVAETCPVLRAQARAMARELARV